MGQCLLRVGGGEIVLLPQPIERTIGHGPIIAEADPRFSAERRGLTQPSRPQIIRVSGAIRFICGRPGPADKRDYTDYVDS